MILHHIILCYIMLCYVTLAILYFITCSMLLTHALHICGTCGAETSHNFTCGLTMIWKWRILQRDRPENIKCVHHTIPFFILSTPTYAITLFLINICSVRLRCDVVVNLNFPSCSSYVECHVVYHNMYTETAGNSGLPTSNPGREWAGGPIWSHAKAKEQLLYGRSCVKFTVYTHVCKKYARCRV